MHETKAQFVLVYFLGYIDCVFSLLPVPSPLCPAFLIVRTVISGTRRPVCLSVCAVWALVAVWDIGPGIRGSREDVFGLATLQIYSVDVLLHLCAELKRFPCSFSHKHPP